MTAGKMARRLQAMAVITPVCMSVPTTASRLHPLDGVGAVLFDANAGIMNDIPPVRHRARVLSCVLYYSCNRGPVMSDLRVTQATRIYARFEVWL